MRFLHLADLHLGKSLGQFSLIEDQTYMLQQICTIARREHVSALLIAGDIFDRSQPPLEAVHLLDRFLTELVRQHIALFMISGNHDSGVRLAFGSEIFQSSDLCIVSRFEGQIPSLLWPRENPVVRIHLLPFLRRDELRRYCTDEDAAQLDTAELLRRLLERQKPPQEGLPQILLAHLWVASSSLLLSDSENTLLGSVESVPKSLFEAYDYVALGHLHRPQNVDEKLRYAGSPLAYSASETGQPKSLTLLELQDGKLEQKKIELKPLHPVLRLRGPLDELLARSRKDPTWAGEAYVYVELTDFPPPHHALQRLEAVFPRLVQLSFVRLKDDGGSAADSESVVGNIRQDPEALFAAFYREEQGRELSAWQKEKLHEVFAEAAGGKR